MIATEMRVKPDKDQPDKTIIMTKSHLAEINKIKRQKENTGQ